MLCSVIRVSDLFPCWRRQACCPAPQSEPITARQAADLVRLLKSLAGYRGRGLQQPQDGTPIYRRRWHERSRASGRSSWPRVTSPGRNGPSGGKTGTCSSPGTVRSVARRNAGICSAGVSDDRASMLARTGGIETVSRCVHGGLGRLRFCLYCGRARSGGPPVYRRTLDARPVSPAPTQA